MACLTFGRQAFCTAAAAARVEYFHSETFSYKLYPLVDGMSFVSTGRAVRFTWVGAELRCNPKLWIASSQCWRRYQSTSKSGTGLCSKEVLC